MHETEILYTFERGITKRVHEMGHAGPERIAWIRRVTTTHPTMATTRVSLMDSKNLPENEKVQG